MGYVIKYDLTVIYTDLLKIPSPKNPDFWVFRKCTLHKNPDSHQNWLHPWVWNLRKAVYVKPQNVS